MNSLSILHCAAVMGIVASSLPVPALQITAQSPTGVTSSLVSRVELTLTDPVIGTDARAAANYTLLHLGTNGVPGGGDDRGVALTALYTDGSAQIELLPLSTNRVDLRSWREWDYENGASGTWSVAADGQSVLQTVNGQPTFFVSDFDFADNQFIGRIRVSTTADDDLIGLVFAFQGVATNSKPNNFYCLSWKRANQTGSEVGFKLLRIHDTSELTATGFANLLWDGENGPNITVLARNNATGTGWAYNTDYDFSVLYRTNGEIAVSIRQTSNGSVRWQTNVVDATPLGAGQTGFFNYSQASVRYSGLAQSTTLTEGVYQLTARSGNPGLRTTAGEALDGNADGTPGDDYVSTFTIDLTSPSVTSLTPAGFVLSDVSVLRVTFSEAIDPATFTGADVELAGPAGALDSGLFTITPGDGGTFDVTLPTQSLEGNYLVSIGPNVLDLAGHPLTASFTQQFTIVRWPDLVVSDVDASATAWPRQEVLVSWAVTNRGRAAPTNVWVESIALSSDGAVGGDQLVALLTVTDMLAPGEGIVRTNTVRMPLNSAAGDLRFVVTTDSEADVMEEDEANNAAIADGTTHVDATLFLEPAATDLQENSGPVSVVLRRNGSLASALTVAITVSDTNELALPASVVIPQNQSYVVFSVTPRADGVVDGPQTLSLSATANAFLPATAQFTVADMDQPALTLTPANPTLYEGDRLTMRVSRSLATADPLTVALASSRGDQVSVPRSVIIASNAGFADFTVEALNDDLIEPEIAYLLTASATGHVAAAARVVVPANDLPSLTLAFGAPSIAENGGLFATTLTLTRSPVTSRPLFLLFESSDPGLLRLSSIAAIEAGQNSVTLAVGVNDDALVNGPRVVRVDAFIVAQGTALKLSSGISADLLVTDDDSPALTVALARDVVPEGAANATMGTIRRNTGSSGALVVSLASSDLDEATVPPTITIPDGQTQAPFTLSTVADGVSDGSKSVIITASAAGFQDGTDMIIVSDAQAPDLVITHAAGPASGATEEFFQVSLRESNLGLGPASGPWTERIFLSRDPQPGGDELLGEVSFSGTLPAGQYVERTLTFRLPKQPGNYWIVAQADATNSVAELAEDNNTTISALPIHVEPAYTAIVQADVEAAVAGTPIPMSGLATNQAGDPAPFELVNIHLHLRETHRVISALTGADGRFSASFTPVPGEAGRYFIGAAHPGFSDAPAQDQFTLLGLRFATNQLALTFNARGTATGQVDLINLGDLPITGLQAAVLGANADLQTDVSIPSALPGDGTVKLAYAIASVSDNGVTGTLIVRVTGANGETAELPMPINVRAQLPILLTDPSAMDVGMVRGAQTVVSFEVMNRGGAESGPLSVSLPTVPWLSAASEEIPSLAPGESATVTLLLNPPADLGLGEYTGRVGVVGEGTHAIVPFTFRALSDALGALRVEAQDEFTFYAEGAPRVAGAQVLVKDPFTRELLHEALTDNNGLAFFADLPEGYYRIEVSADQHSRFANNFFVAAGRTNELAALMARETVRYIWSVTPTEIPDRTRITIETEFETFVPVPVVTMSPKVLYLDELTNEVNQVEITVRNHGLIAAQNLRFVTRDSARWAVTPLVRELGDLPAQSSFTVPFTFRRLSGARAQAKDGGGACTPFVGSLFQYLCGVQTVQRGDQIVPVDPVDCGLGPAPQLPPNPISISNPRDGGTQSTRPIDDPWEGGDVQFVTVPSYTYKSCEDCLQALADALKECLLSQLPDGDNPLGCLIDYGQCLDNLGTNVTLEAVLRCQYEYADCMDLLPGIADVIECIWNILHACAEPNPPGGEGGGAAWAASLKSSGSLVDLEPEYSRVGTYHQRLMTVVDAFHVYVGETGWLTTAQRGPAFADWMNAFNLRCGTSSGDGAKVSAGERAELLGLTPPVGVSVASLNKFLDRWNRSVDYWAAGIRNTADVPPGQSADFIALDVMAAAARSVRDAELASIGEGFPNAIAGANDAVAKLREKAFALLAARGSAPSPLAERGTAKSNGAGVCARVKLRLDQEAVLTRDAFNAALEIINHSSPITQLRVDLQIKATDGADATALFAFRPPTLSGLSDVSGGGSVGAGTSGKADWILVPTLGAAPGSEAVQYFVSGSLSFVQDEVEVHLPLSPAPITVYPSPRLSLRYFHERDVRADDPFTAAIEPSLPFSLGVMVENRGFGLAKNFTITSGQPEIIDNLKGLLIDFDIIATEVAGQNLSPALTAGFGDIPPGEVKIARWLFKSTLQGLFLDYSATFQHLDAIGDARLSLIDDVSIHELIQIVAAPGAYADGNPDFLVNDISDDEDLPDTVHLSDASIAAVTPIVTGTTPGTPQPGSLTNRTIHFTANVPAGFVYVRAADPAPAGLRLAQVRRSDGVDLALGVNAWTTDRTFIGRGQRPRYENRIHLFDHDSTGSYVFIYEEEADRLDVTAPSSAVVALPEFSYEQFAVRWAGQDETDGSGLAGYDVFVSDNGGAFQLWLSNTLQTTALFQGEAGHQYAFYSVATDKARNREVAPPTHDTQTTASLFNTGPLLTVSPTRIVNESTTVIITNSATDADVPANALTFALLPGAPAGASISATTGRITWPTSERTGPSTNVFRVRVTDNGVPSLSATGSVIVIVNEVNTAPTLAPIAARTINEGALLAFTASASDSDLPANSLSFTLDPNAPSGTYVHPLTGAFSWRPSEFQGPSTNVLRVIVTDDGAPSLSATQSFTVVVRDVLSDFALGLGSTNVFAGESNAVPIVLHAGLDLTNVSFLLDVPFGHLSALALQATSTEVTSSLLLPQSSNRTELTFVLDPDQFHAGSRPLAWLGFTALENQRSAIVPLNPSQLLGIRDGQIRVENSRAFSGRVMVVRAEPLLDIAVRPEDGPKAVLYGQPGASYLIEAADTVPSADWSAVTSLTLSGRWQVVPLVPATNRLQFYRARKQ